MKSFFKVVFCMVLVLCLSISYNVQAKEITFEEFKSDFIANSTILNNINERMNMGEVVLYNLEETDDSLLILINDEVPVKFLIQYQDGVISFEDDSVITGKDNDNAIINTLFVNDVIKRVGVLNGYVESDINRFSSTDLTKYTLENDGISLQTADYSYDTVIGKKPVSLKLSLANGFGGLTSTFVEEKKVEEVVVENQDEQEEEKSMKIPVAIACLGGFVGLGILSAFKLNKKED